MTENPSFIGSLRIPAQSRRFLPANPGRAGQRRSTPQNRPSAASPETQPQATTKATPIPTSAPFLSCIWLAGWN